MTREAHGSAHARATTRRSARLLSLSVVLVLLASAMGAASASAESAPLLSVATLTASQDRIPETVATTMTGLAPTRPRHVDAVLSRVGLHRSDLVAATMPFSALAFELPAEVDGIWMRTVGPQGADAWTFLEVLEAEEGPDAGTDEAVAAVDTAITDLAWVGVGTHLEAIAPATIPLDAVQVHLIDTLGLGEGLLDEIAARVVSSHHDDILDPINDLLAELIGDEEEDPPPPSARRHWTDGFRASSARPAVTTRAGWGANESWRRGRPTTARPRFGVVHHTATRNDYSRSEAPAIVRAIYSYHTRTLGWSDIGYNLLIDRYGRVYEGRAGGLEAGVVGAHARGYNSGSFGVALIGNFEDGYATHANLQALSDVFAWQYRVHRIDPAAGATTVHNGRRIATLIGHRDVGSTVCPGYHVAKHLPEVRRQVARAR